MGQTISEASLNLLTIFGLVQQFLNLTEATERFSKSSVLCPCGVDPVEDLQVIPFTVQPDVSAYLAPSFPTCEER